MPSAAAASSSHEQPRRAHEARVQRAVEIVVHEHNRVRGEEYVLSKRYAANLRASRCRQREQLLLLALCETAIVAEENDYTAQRIGGAARRYARTQISDKLATRSEHHEHRRRPRLSDRTPHGVECITFDGREAAQLASRPRAKRAIIRGGRAARASLTLLERGGGGGGPRSRRPGRV